MESEVDERVRVKSGGGEMVTVTVALCESVPEVPVRVNIVLPSMADAEAVSVMGCGVPGVRVSVAGCAVTPAGKPVIATDTMLAKPFTGGALTLICGDVPPGVSVTVVGRADKEKSGMNGAGDPPPQEVRTRLTRVKHAKSTFEQECISTTPALSVKHRPTCLSVAPRQIESTPVAWCDLSRRCRLSVRGGGARNVGCCRRWLQGGERFSLSGEPVCQILLQIAISCFRRRRCG